MAPCVFCSGETYILDTRQSGVSYVRRRRECSDCGKRFTTHEIPIADAHAKEIVEWAAAEAKGLNDE